MASEIDRSDEALAATVSTWSLATNTNFRVGVDEPPLGIDYPDFKSEVQRRLGRERHDVLLSVWATLHGLEKEDPGAVGPAR